MSGGQVANAESKGRPFVSPGIGIAVGLAVAHIGTLIALAKSPSVGEVSDFFTLAASLLAAAACFIAAHRSLGIARRFWQLSGSTFALWSLGKCIVIYDFYVLGMETLPIVPLLIFFLSATPMFVAVFASRHDSRSQINWEGLLDAIQILSLILFIYLFVVYVPLLDKGESAVSLMEDRLILVRNTVLAVGLLARAAFTRSRYVRCLYLPVAIIMVAYAVTTWVGNRRQSEGHAFAAYDLAWTIPFCMIAATALWWQQPAEEPGGLWRPQRLSGVVFAYLPSLALPIMLLVKRHEVLAAQISLGLVGLMFSIVLFNVRLAVTHRRQNLTMDALAASERKYHSLFERNMAGVYRSTVDGTLLDCNPAFADMFGYTREELLRLNMEALYPEGAVERSRFIEELREGRLPTTREYGFRRKDSSTVWVVQNVSIEKQEDGSEVLEGTLVDTTERRALEAQFRQAQKMEAIGRLAGGVAHDFNNLLTIISGYSSMQLDRTKPSDPVHHEAEQITAAADRAAALTRQLLAFSRQQVLQPRKLNLNDVVRTIERMLRRLIGEDIEVLTALAPDLGTVEVDPGQIEQILMNLVVNARDAMPQGGKLTIQTVNVDLDQAYLRIHEHAKVGRHVLLAVSDTGMGMSPDTAARIFEPFFTTKEPGKGTGLGMSMVYGSVRQSGGSIEISSKLNQGTTVKIYLPCMDAAVEKVSPAADVSRPLAGSEKLLLVEDDADLRSLMTKVLTSHGYKVEILEQVQDVEERCKVIARCDLLVTDIVMPTLNGTELAAKVAGCWPEIKILYMSGYTTDAIVHQGALKRGFHFLQKPFTPAALVSKVRETLDAPKSQAHSSGRPV